MQSLHQADLTPRPPSLNGKGVPFEQVGLAAKAGAPGSNRKKQLANVRRSFFFPRSLQPAADCLLLTDFYFRPSSVVFRLLHPSAFILNSRIASWSTPANLGRSDRLVRARRSVILVRT